MGAIQKNSNFRSDCCTESDPAEVSKFRRSNGLSPYLLLSRESWEAADNVT
jgi:hypothetical protein